VGVPYGLLLVSRLTTPFKIVFRGLLLGLLLVLLYAVVWSGVRRLNELKSLLTSEINLRLEGEQVELFNDEYP
jgi:hypothetical protein